MVSAPMRPAPSAAGGRPPRPGEPQQDSRGRRSAAARSRAATEKHREHVERQRAENDAVAPHETGSRPAATRRLNGSVRARPRATPHQRQHDAAEAPLQHDGDAIDRRRAPAGTANAAQRRADDLPGLGSPRRTTPSPTAPRRGTSVEMIGGHGRDSRRRAPSPRLAT